MKFVLVLWLTSVYNAGIYAEKLGGIATTQHATEASCEEALARIKQKSQNIDGICNKI